MELRLRRLSSFTLISLLSLFSFSSQTGTQDNVFAKLGGPQGKTAAPGCVPPQPDGSTACTYAPGGIDFQPLSRRIRNNDKNNGNRCPDPVLLSQSIH
jgi:hypothetical protein